VPARRFEGTSLADLTERARSEVGPGARIVRAQRVRRGGLAGFFAREVFVLEVEEPEDRVLEAGSADSLADAVADVVEVDFARSLELALASGHQGFCDPAPEIPPSPPPRRARLVSLSDQDRPSTQAGAHAPDIVHALSAWHERRADSRALLGALTVSLAAAPPLTKGAPSLIVVAGPPDAARADAARLAEPLAAPVVLASTRRPSPFGAQKRAASPGGLVRTLDALAEAASVVVALDWEPGPNAGAAELLAAANEAAGAGGMEVVASLPARLGARDAAWWTKRLGASSLCVHGTGTTLEPASALTLGLPVRLLDGAASTPERWLATLVDARRLEDAPWDEPTR